VLRNDYHIIHQVLSDASQATADAVRKLFGKLERDSELIQLNRDERVDDMTVVVFVGSQVQLLLHMLLKYTHRFTGFATSCS
jgi:hypothetical protein